MDMAITTGNGDAGSLFGIAGLNAVTLGLAAGILVLLIMLLFLTRSYIRLKKRVDNFMGSRSERHNLEAMLLEYLDKVRNVQDDHEKMIGAIRDINKKLAFCIQRVGIVRYNPFNDMGGDLSFALAFLDENGDGVVLNTIRGRDVSYTYGKRITANKSEHNLSIEETEAIERAWKGYSMSVK